jgi:hypothetical protein
VIITWSEPRVTPFNVKVSVAPNMSEFRELVPFRKVIMPRGVGLRLPERGTFAPVNVQLPTRAKTNPLVLTIYQLLLELIFATK